MKIDIIKYKYQQIDNNWTRTKLPQQFFKQLLINICLFLFKIINYRHVYNKNEDGKYYIKQIIQIKGIKTSLYEDAWGQTINGEFMWKFGKFYI